MGLFDRFKSNTATQKKQVENVVSWDEEKTRLIELTRKAIRALNANDANTLFQTWRQIEQLARDAAKIKAGPERELFEDLVRDADSFLTRQAQLLKDGGLLEAALMAHEAVERIRRDVNSPGLVLNLAVQARLLTRVSKPKEAVEKAQQALTIANELGETSIEVEMRRIIETEGKVPSYGIFGE